MRWIKHVLAVCLVCCVTQACFAQDEADTAQQDNTEQAQAQPFKVMCFNIRWGGAQDPPSVWSDRRERVLETIQTYDPDILGVQEAILRQVRYLRDEMDGYVFFGAGRDNGRLAGEMCAIFYRAERFRRVGGGHFWLSDTPEVPGELAWDAGYPRMVSWLKLRDKTNDRILFVANTHFDHRGKKARLNSARLIRERLPGLAEGYPVILMGDFNCDEDSEPYNTLVSDEQDARLALIDAYRQVHPERTEEEATYHGFRGKTEGSRIDWILHGLDLQTLAAEINTTHHGIKYPSDHFPVTATLRMTHEE